MTLAGRAFASDGEAIAPGAALDRVAAAADANSFAEFSEALASARAAAGADPAASRVLEVFDDIERVWRYRLTETTSAFFDDESSGGLFSRLVSRYPDYLRAIQPFAVRANYGRTLYPTAETQAFLRREAAARMAAPGHAVPAAPPRVPPAAPTPPKPLPAEPPEVPRTAAPALPRQPGVDCATVAITALTPATRGLTIHASGPIAPIASVGRETIDELPAALPTLTVEIPNATVAGLSPRIEWPDGPFASARIVRYRNESGCGIRLRLQPRVEGNWHVMPSRAGAMVALDRAAVAEGEESGAGGGRPGIASVSATMSGSRQSERGGSPSSGVVTAAFAQALASGPELRGFATQVTSSRRESGSPFVGVGISNMNVGSARLDAAAGDMLVVLGDTGDSALPSITSTLFRGAGISVRPTDDVAVQAFGGRAASASLVRVGLESTFSPDAHDRVVGAQLSWLPEGNVSAAAGALHTASPGGAVRTLNVFQAAEYRRSSVLRTRLVLEESHALDTNANGFGITLDAHVSSRRGGLSGYYRALSPHFRPAGGAGFYATLRRAYGVTAAYHDRKFSAAAAASQAKVFSILDPEDVGSLTTSRNVDASYAVSPRVSVQAGYGEAGIRSDPGAKIRAESDSREVNAGVAYGAGRVDASLQVANAVTHNQEDPALDLFSRRVDLTLRSSYGRSLYGRFAFAHSKRRDGTFAGSDYRGTLGAPVLTLSHVTMFAEAGVAVTPAGVAQTAFRQSFATLRVSPTGRWLSGGLQVTYVRVAAGERKYDALFASVSTSKVVRWGEGSFFAPQLDSRALRFDRHPTRTARSARIDVTVFEDADHNGRRDEGERAITPSSVSIGGRVYRTDGAGRVSAEVVPGKTKIVLLPRGAVFGYFIPVPMITVDAATNGQVVAAFGLQPAGRIAGRLKARGQIDARALANIYVRAVGIVERQVFTNAEGAFDFGFLPEGDYRVSIATPSLEQARLVAVEPLEVAVHLSRGKRQDVVLEVRRMTARERFGR